MRKSADLGEKGGTYYVMSDRDEPLEKKVTISFS